jgi:hypothetical protein
MHTYYDELSYVKKILPLPKMHIKKIALPIFESNLTCWPIQFWYNCSQSQVYLNEWQC